MSGFWPRIRLVKLALGLSLCSAALAQHEDQAYLLKKADSLITISPVEAEVVLREFIDEHSSAGNCNVIGRAHRLLALIYSTHSRRADQIDHLFKSYQAYKDCHNENEMAEGQRLIGHYYLKFDLLPQAKEYLDEALSLARARHDTIITIKVLSNLAQYHDTGSQSAKTLDLYLQAIALSEKIGFKKGLQENWNRISYAYWKTGQPEQMLASMRNAFKYRPSNQDTLGVLYGDLGLAFMEVGVYDSADFYLQKGISLIRKGNNAQQEMLLTKLLSLLRQKQKRFPEALELLQSYDTLRIKLFTNQLMSEVSHAESRYDQLARQKELTEAMSNSRRLTIALVSILAVLLVLIVALFRLRNRRLLIARQKDKLDDALKGLEAREHLLRQLFDKSPSLILTHSVEGKIISANETLQNHFQLTQEKIIGKSLRDLIPPLYYSQFEDFIGDLKENGSSSGWLNITDRAGVNHVIRYQSKVISLGSEEPYCISFGLDDTGAHQARTEADQERKRLRSVMDSSPEVYCILRSEGTIVFLNRLDFFGDPEAVGKNVLNFLPPDQGERFFQKLKLAFETHAPQELEEHYRGRIYLGRLIPIVSNNTVKEVLTIGTDITENKLRVERENELHRKIENSERRYRRLVEESMVLICSHDMDGYLTTVNKPGAESLGYRQDELVGKRLDTLIHEDYRAGFPVYMDQIKNTGSFEGFLTICEKNGTKRIFLCKNVLLKEENMVLGSAQDVTDWKKAEFRERQIKKELLLAKEKAEESNRLKTIFLGSLSHEVRTPLQGILGFAEILDSPGLPEEKRKEYLNIIQRRATDMQNIIEALLDMASVESGEIKPLPIETNLYEFAEFTFLKWRQEYPMLKPIELQLDNKLTPTDRVRLDPQHLAQVVLNLFRNAVKFTEQGSVVFSYVKKKDHFVISVSDTGIGIAPENLIHIFEPFRQAHEGISRSKGGIGLGLAIARRLVEMWGGEITVESSPEKGSTFSVTIPFHPSNPV